MEIKEALNILDRVAANYKGTRQEHGLLVQALKLVKERTEDESAKQEKIENA